MPPLAGYLPAPAAMRTDPGLPYWLAQATENCTGCTHTYVLQVERRCTGCDRGFCEHCVTVVRETHEVRCRECAESGETD